MTGQRVALAAGMLLLAAACHDNEVPAPPARAVIAQQVTETIAQDVEHYTGAIQARYQSVLGFRTAGKILARPVDVGDRVGKGDVLARLDPADAGIAVEAAEAAVRAALAERDQAASELVRAEKLTSRGFTAPALRDARRNHLNAAEANLSAARHQHELARNQLAYTTLHAPEGGIVAAVRADMGNVVSSGEPVIELARDGEWELVVDIPEGRLKTVGYGTPVRVTLWSLPGRDYTGHVREIAAQADTTTRTYRVKVTLSEMAADVRLGMTATAWFAGEQEKAIRLPLSSLYRDGEKPAVWVIDPGSARVQLRRVTIGGFREQEMEVATGLEAGDTVVTKGVHKLHAGERVVPLLTNTGGDARNDAGDKGAPS